MAHLSPSSVALWMMIVLLASSGQLSFKAAAADSTSAGLVAGWLRMLRRPWLWLASAAS